MLQQGENGQSTCRNYSLSCNLCSKSCNKGVLTAPRSWLLAVAVLSLSAEPVRGGAMAGGSLVSLVLNEQEPFLPVTSRAVSMLRGGGARRLRTHPTALSLSLSLHLRLRLSLSPGLRLILSSAQTSA